MEELVDSTTGVYAATLVDVVASPAAVDTARGVDEVEATTAATTDEDAEEDPEDPKLLEAVVDAPLLTSTLLIMRTSPLSLVILTSTVVVPNPEDCSKKLYVCLVVDCQMLPPSVLTSRDDTAWLAFTTCMLNQYSETPSLL